MKFNKEVITAIGRLAGQLILEESVKQGFQGFINVHNQYKSDSFNDNEYSNEIEPFVQIVFAVIKPIFEKIRDGKSVSDVLVSNFNQQIERDVFKIYMNLNFFDVEMQESALSTPVPTPTSVSSFKSVASAKPVSNKNFNEDLQLLNSIKQSLQEYSDAINDKSDDLISLGFPIHDETETINTTQVAIELVSQHCQKNDITVNDHKDIFSQLFSSLQEHLFKLDSLRIIESMPIEFPVAARCLASLQVSNTALGIISISLSAETPAGSVSSYPATPWTVTRSGNDDDTPTPKDKKRDPARRKLFVEKDAKQDLADDSDDDKNDRYKYV